MCSRSRRIWLTIAVIALCGLHAWMAASVSRTFSTTADEIAHLTAGYSYWTLGDYRLQPENGNLPQRWAALPLLAMDVTYPPREGENWTGANVWRFGYEFLFKQGNDTAVMLAAGRAMIAALSAGLCLLVFFWTRDLFGWRTGVYSLVFAAFSPELLAHGGLATSDTAAALGFILAVLAWWRLLRLVTPGRFLAAGLCVGLLAVSKHSVVLFAPIAVLMAVIRLLRPAPLVIIIGRRRLALNGVSRTLAACGLLAGSALVCFAVIWSFYGFRYSAAPSGAGQVGFALTWEQVLMKDEAPYTGIPEPGGERVDRSPGIVQSFVEFTRDHRLLPEAWLYGLAFVEKNSRARLAYFAGEYRSTGWLTFFPVAFATKSTLAALIAFACGGGALFFTRRDRRRVLLYRISPLLVLLLVYWAFSLQSKLNIGHRHLLPTYPACYIVAGAGIALLKRRRLGIVAITLLLGWHVAASVHARPDYLAYFNPIAGNPNEAHRLFVDSSLDWGQDLPRLHQWLDLNAKGESIFLSYFGSGSPMHEGIVATRFADGYFDWEPRRTPSPLKGGVYCISATMFRRVYTHVRGPWNLEKEERYKHISAWMNHMAKQPAGSAPTDINGASLDALTVKSRLFECEQLQFGRLIHFLQFREPDAFPTRSFLVFRLTDDEIAFALKAPLPALNVYLLNAAAQR